MKDFRGKVVVITGAGSGLGRALAMRLHHCGAHLALCDVNLVGLEETRAFLDGSPDRVSLHQVELSQEYADRIIGLTEGHVVFDSQKQTLDEASINMIYSNTPHGENPSETTFDGVPAGDNVVTQPST